MLNINAIMTPRYPVYNCTVPAERSKGVPLLLDFNLSASYTINGQLLSALAKFESIQTVWIDTTGATAAFTLTVSGTLQRITVLPDTQGYYPVCCPNPFTLTFDSATASIVEVILLNMPIAVVQISLTTPVPPVGSDAMVFLLKQDAALQVSLDFKTVFADNPSYDDFWIEFVNVIPQVNFDSALIQFSTDGINPDGGTNYNWAVTTDDGSAQTQHAAAGDTAFSLDGNSGITNNAAKGGEIMSVKVYSPANAATVRVRLAWNGSVPDSGEEIVCGSGSYVGLTASVKGFFVVMSGADNIKSGSVRVYGIQKA